MQHSRIELFADDDAAVRKAEMQEASRSLGLMNFERMLQYQDFGRVRDGRGKVADAGALCP